MTDPLYSLKFSETDTIHGLFLDTCDNLLQGQTFALTFDVCWFAVKHKIELQVWNTSPELFYKISLTRCCDRDLKIKLLMRLNPILPALGDYMIIIMSVTAPSSMNKIVPVSNWIKAFVNWLILASNVWCYNETNCFNSYVKTVLPKPPSKPINFFYTISLWGLRVICNTSQGYGYWSCSVIEKGDIPVLEI